MSHTNINITLTDIKNDDRISAVSLSPNTLYIDDNGIIYLTCEREYYTDTYYLLRIKENTIKLISYDCKLKLKKIHNSKLEIITK